MGPAATSWLIFAVVGAAGVNADVNARAVAAVPAVIPRSNSIIEIPFGRWSYCDLAVFTDQLLWMRCLQSELATTVPANFRRGFLVDRGSERIQTESKRTGGFFPATED